MLKRSAVAVTLLVLVAAVAAQGLGCGKPRQKRTGALKDWIVGDWSRQDDPNWWNFSASGEMMTTGRVPFGGSYSVEEPNKVEVVISGAGAATASSILGIPVDPVNRNLYVHLIVEDDEMRPAGVKSDTVFRKK
jgi:hypothetical protein